LIRVKAATLVNRAILCFAVVGPRLERLVTQGRNPELLKGMHKSTFKDYKVIIEEGMRIDDYSTERSNPDNQSTAILEFTGQS
jgi:hypothetical protein